MKTKKRIIIATIITMLIVAVGFFGSFWAGKPIKDFIRLALAGSEHNVSGWAWSENVGWISFNSANCDTNNDGKSEGGTGCPAAGKTISNYGVNIDPAIGNFSGFAWSENIGWIKFDPVGPYPGQPNHSAQLNIFNNQVTGWARACAGSIDGQCGNASRTDGWDGWIKMAKDPADGGASYSVNLSSCYLTGYSWGSDVVGWASFKGTAQDSSPYGVMYQCPPSANNLAAVGADYCRFGTIQIFTWNFTDLNPGDTQSAYHLQIYQSGTLVYDSGKIFSNSHAFAATAAGLDYNKTYSWQLQVWDSAGLASGWLPGPSFNTPAHQYPTVDFTWVTDPDNNKKLTFIDQSTAYGGASITQRAWAFAPDATPASSANAVVSVIFASSGAKTATLQVKDSDNYTCSVSQTVNLGKKFKWKEILPW